MVKASFLKTKTESVLLLLFQFVILEHKHNSFEFHISRGCLASDNLLSFCRASQFLAI